MSDGFVKLYGHKLLNSTLWRECWQARLVFVGMLALSDKDGVVDIHHVDILAHRLNLPVEDVETGLAVLEAPDGRSRTPDHDGRRVLRNGDHWLIVNKEKYREYRTRAQELGRKRTATCRTKKRSAVPDAPLQVTPVTNSNACNARSSSYSSSDLSDSDAHVRDVDAPAVEREPGEPDPDPSTFEVVRDEIRLAWPQGTGQPIANGSATIRHCRTLADWLTLKGGNPLVLLRRMLKAFFADEGARLQGHPLAFLAANPGKYLNPPPAASQAPSATPPAKKVEHDW